MLDAQAGIKFYPRGFVGASLPVRLAVKPKPYEFKIRSKPQVGVIIPQMTSADPNQVIEMLYSQYVKRSADTQSFEFREAILIAALNAFGSPNFYSWYKSQLQSPTVGERHVAFLGDTLKFLMTGRRDMTLETWAVLLKPDAEAVRPLEPCETACRYFGLQGRNIPADPVRYSLVDTIQQWCEMPQGIEDLLGTLHVLFGNL
jgi:hypothetical protein